MGASLDNGQPPFKPIRLDGRKVLAIHARCAPVGAALGIGMRQACFVDVVHEVPEAAKPRTIKIGTAAEPVQPQVTEQSAA